MEHMTSLVVVGLIALFFTAAPLRAEEPAAAGARLDPVPLWPGAAPGDKGDIGEEKDQTQHDPKAAPGSEVIRLGNVSKPTVTIFRPAADKATGAAVVVCPGGGYSILAWDLEGTEICEWLNSVGVTGVLLKYRVPGRGDPAPYGAPLQDAQRTLGLVRQKAAEWGIDPKRVGILGFSAGAHLAAVASCNYEARSYPAVDEADKQSGRPDFTILIYPAYLVAKDDPAKSPPEIKVTSQTPPAFIAQTQDDPVGVDNAFRYAMLLKAAKVPVELHVYPKGGHGYGLRPSPNAVTHWPERAAEWMKGQGWLKTKAE